MLPLSDIYFTLQIFQKHFLLNEAAQLILQQFKLQHTNLERFNFTEPVQNGLLVMTTVGVLGKPQTINIPSNAFLYDAALIVNLIAHEMHHVKQKAPETLVLDKNEREFQAYSEMIFHEIFPLVPEVSDKQKVHFINKAFDYYARMGENSELQQKYELQKNRLEIILKQLTFKI